VRLPVVGTESRFSQTWLGVAIGTNHASSKLPKRSGLWRVMHGDGGSTDPSDPSSSSDKCDHCGNNPSGESDSDPEGSMNYNGHNLFRKEPESDHSSDSKDTKHWKSNKCKRHHAKLQEIKFQQSFLKQDPLFKYVGEVQASSKNGSAKCVTGSSEAD
jgi:hypothetical protein